MQELFDQIVTPEVKMVLYLMVVCVVMLYILSIVYVIRDAQRRGAEPWWMWAIISVIPVVGLLAYVILRPSSYLIDREEQDLDIALREHQLSHYGICPKCGAPIDRDFVVCPICNTQVRNVCPTCHRPLNADWKVCAETSPLFGSLAERGSFFLWCNFRLLHRRTLALSVCRNWRGARLFRLGNLAIGGSFSKRAYYTARSEARGGGIA